MGGVAQQIDTRGSGRENPWSSARVPRGESSFKCERAVEDADDGAGPMAPPGEVEVLDEVLLVGKEFANSKGLVGWSPWSVGHSPRIGGGWSCFRLRPNWSTTMKSSSRATWPRGCLGRGRDQDRWRRSDLLWNQDASLAALAKTDSSTQSAAAVSSGKGV